MNKAFVTKGFTVREHLNALWILVFRHNVTFGYFSKNDVLKCNKPGKYSILGRIDDFEIDNKYEFLLEYPELNGLYNRWTQTSNPAKSTEVEGYNEISASFKDNNWIGLTLSTSTDRCFIDGANGSWFFAIGQYNKWEYGEIAGPYPSNKPNTNYLFYEVSLWERISLKTFNSLVSGSCKYEDNINLLVLFSIQFSFFLKE